MYFGCGCTLIWPVDDVHEGYQTSMIIFVSIAILTDLNDLNIMLTHSNMVQDNNSADWLNWMFICILLKLSVIDMFFVYDCRRLIRDCIRWLSWVRWNLSRRIFPVLWSSNFQTWIQWYFYHLWPDFGEIRSCGGYFLSLRCWPCQNRY